GRVRGRGAQPGATTPWRGGAPRDGRPPGAVPPGKAARAGRRPCWNQPAAFALAFHTPLPNYYRVAPPGSGRWEACSPSARGFQLDGDAAPPPGPRPDACGVPMATPRRQGVVQPHTPLGTITPVSGGRNSQAA